MYHAFIRQEKNENKPEKMPSHFIWQEMQREENELTLYESENGWEILDEDSFKNLKLSLENEINIYLNSIKPEGQPVNFSKTVFDKYMARYMSIGNILAQICAENEARLLNGVWTIQKLQTLMNSKEFSAVFMSLLSLSYPTALGVLSQIPETILEKEVKIRYENIIKENMKF